METLTKAKEYEKVSLTQKEAQTLGEQLAAECGGTVLAVSGCQDSLDALSGREYETLDGGAKLYAVPAEVMEAVRRLRKETGMTVILITHHMDEAAQADRVVVMRHGKVALDVTPKAVFSQVEALSALALEAPQTVQLLYALDPAGDKLSLEALSVEECAGEIIKYLGESAQ